MAAKSEIFAEQLEQKLKNNIKWEKETEKRDKLERAIQGFKFGFLLKKALEEKQLTQTERSNLVTKKEYVSRIENNRTYWTLKTLCNIV